MPVEKYRGISLQRELVDIIEDYIKEHPETGYKSLADFVTEAVRKRCEELQILGPKPIVHPVLEHFNVYEDHVTIIDRKRERLVDVFFRNNVVYCQLCGKRNCEHVKYAIQIPKVKRILEEKGLTIKPNGRIEPKTNLY